jgi:hypothetical protein
VRFFHAWATLLGQEFSKSYLMMKNLFLYQFRELFGPERTLLVMKLKLPAKIALRGDKIAALQPRLQVDGALT